MSNYLARKIPTANSLQDAINYEALAAIQAQGWELPCEVVAVSSDGNFVTVNITLNSLSVTFENITIPIYQSQYLRAPIQVGDVGVTKKIDVSLYATTHQYGNITAPNFGDSGNYDALLGFMPIASQATFPTTSDANQTWIYGIQGHGVKITDNPNPSAANSTVTITNTSVKLQSGSSYIQINKDGTIVIQGTAVTIMGKDFLGHTHSGVQTGTSNTGGVS